MIIGPKRPYQVITLTVAHVISREVYLIAQDPNQVVTPYSRYSCCVKPKRIN
jgi:hypothetical protein